MPEEVLPVLSVNQLDEPSERGPKVWLIQEVGPPFGRYGYEAAVPLASGWGGGDLVEETAVILASWEVKQCRSPDVWGGE